MAAVIRGRWRIRIHSLRPRLLTRIVSRRMIFVVDAATRRDREQPESETKTLGDLLYANKANFSVSEKDWVRLVQAIAARDQLALHSLYEQTHRIVFTLIVRITNNRETAEELTIDVFYDVWRRASAYDPAGGSVVGWIMNQARSRAIDRLRFENRKKRVNPYPENPVPRQNSVRTENSAIPCRDGCLIQVVPSPSSAKNLSRGTRAVYLYI